MPLVNFLAVSTGLLSLTENSKTIDYLIVI